MVIINDLMSLIYPRHCEACEANLLKHEEFICTLCLINLPKSNYHKNNTSELSYVFAGRIPLQNALCFYIFEKSGRVQQLLHAIKYQNQKELAEFIGKLYAKDLKESEVLKNVDVVLPIPLHTKKLKQRGYNQSEWFAKGINNISSTTPIPQQSFTTDVLRGFNTLFVTIVNTKGEILFNMIPYASLYPINGKIFPYNAVNIDTKKCYFTYSPGVRIGGPLSAQLGFLMNYQ
jgi:hypothetical protein